MCRRFESFQAHPFGWSEFPLYMKENTALSPSATSFPVVGAPPCELMCERIPTHPCLPVSGKVRRRKGHADGERQAAGEGRRLSLPTEEPRRQGHRVVRRVHRRGREAQKGLRQDQGGGEIADDADDRRRRGGHPPVCSRARRGGGGVPGVVAYRLPGEPQSNVLPPIRALRPEAPRARDRGRTTLEAPPPTFRASIKRRSGTGFLPGR